MTNCRSCGAEIAKSAVTCPHCGARNKRKHVLLWVVLGVLALIIIGAAGSGGSEPAPAAASHRQPHQSPKARRPSKRPLAWERARS